MKCSNCQNPIPEGAKKCHYCYEHTNGGLPTYPYPNGDMRDCKTCLFVPDDQRKRARQTYIDNLPEIRQLRLNKVVGNEKKKRLMSKLALGMFIFFVLICIICSVSWEISEYIIMGVPIGFVTFAVISVVTLAKPTQSSYSLQLDKEAEVHLSKSYYYYSHKTIGFSKFERRYKDKNGNVTEYYRFYEVDRTNIKGIYYDSKYAEYVLVLYRPIYMDYDLQPKCEFRIPDIFDEMVLSRVLGCDLPARNVPF